MFRIKTLQKEKKNTRKTGCHVEILEIKYIVIEIKNSVGTLNSRLDMSEGKFMNKELKLKHHTRMYPTEITRWKTWKGG